MPLMRAQMQAEFELAHTQWRTDTPPTPGLYLLRVTNDQATWRRIEQWDGTAWATLGGYATPTGWLPLPPV
jgi:hypothetical protein